MKFRMRLHQLPKRYQLFPKVPHGSLERPSERVGLLLGMDCADLMPVGGDPQIGGHQGNLVCMKTVLGGSGYILGGSHPLISSSDADFERVQAGQGSGAQVPHH